MHACISADDLAATVRLSYYEQQRVIATTKKYRSGIARGNVARVHSGRRCRNETRAYATKQRLVALDRVPIIETKEKQSGNEREFFLDARCQLFSIRVHANPRLTE